MKFDIKKDAFNGPFKCHGNTILKEKKISVDGNVFSYSVWECPKCKKEFLDSSQARRMEIIWAFEKLLSDNTLSMRRAVNFDGKMYFLRFPMELTKNWKNCSYADIKMIDTHKFIVEVKCS